MALAATLPDADRLLNALGDPSRRAIVGSLSQGPSTVSQLATTLGITRTGVGQHLAVLEACELVKTVKSGRVRTCELDPNGLIPLENWIAHHRNLWSERLDQLGEFLDERSP